MPISWRSRSLFSWAKVPRWAHKLEVKTLHDDVEPGRQKRRQEQDQESSHVLCESKPTIVDLAVSKGYKVFDSGTRHAKPVRAMPATKPGWP